jgi:hypothetical protein
MVAYLDPLLLELKTILYYIREFSSMTAMASIPPVAHVLCDIRKGPPNLLDCSINT